MVAVVLQVRWWSWWFNFHDGVDDQDGNSNGEHPQMWNKNGEHYIISPNQGLGADSLFEDPDFPADRLLLLVALIGNLKFKIDAFLHYSACQEIIKTMQVFGWNEITETFSQTLSWSWYRQIIFAWYEVYLSIAATRCSTQAEVLKNWHTSLGRDLTSWSKS